MRYLAFALALVSCASLPAMPAPSTPVASATVAASASPESAAALGFDGERAHQHLAYLADPARGGRFTGSPGFE